MNDSNLFKIFSFVPIINLISLLLLILQAYLLFDRMPTYGTPDPKTLPFTYTFFLILEFLLLFSLLYYPYSIFRAIYEKKLNRIILLKYISVYIIGFVLLIIIFRVENLNLGEWILD
jgi:hypothetical protein